MKDLEIELSKVKQKGMESLQHAVAIEREGYMNLQWELEESKVALARAEKEAKLAQVGDYCQKLYGIFLIFNMLLLSVIVITGK